MAKPSRLKQLANEIGEAPEVFIPRIVNECGGNQAEAAKKLQIGHSTVNGFLRSHGYVSRIVWVKPDQPGA